MIITVAPFPSIEYIYDVEALTPHSEVSSKKMSLNILSKGIYGAQIMKVLQEEPIFLGSVGGFAGKYIKHYLDKAKVKSDIVWTEYETPHAIKIRETNTDNSYLLQTAHEDFSEREIVKLTQKLKAHIKKVSTLVLVGKLPEYLPANVYKEWVKEAKLHNVKVIVSTGQKEVLEEVLCEKPYGLMFSEEQLKMLQIEVSSEQKILDALTPYLNLGVHYIGIYLGEKGAFMLAKNKYCFIEPIVQKAEGSNTADSGAFLGAFAIGINRKYELEKFARLCMAAAFAADDNVNHLICTKKDIDNKLKKMKIREITR